MQITHLTGNCYLEGNFKMRELKSNYGYPCEFPTVFTANGAGVQSGNWRSCTSAAGGYLLKYLNEQKGFENTTSLYDVKFKGLNESENYEFVGLLHAIDSARDAYEVFRFGNHGTSAGVDIKNQKTAKAIFEGTSVMCARANELLSKIKGIHKPKASQ